MHCHAQVQYKSRSRCRCKHILCLNDAFCSVISVEVLGKSYFRLHFLDLTDKGSSLGSSRSLLSYRRLFCRSSCWQEGVQEHQ